MPNFRIPTFASRTEALQKYAALLEEKVSDSLPRQQPPKLIQYRAYNWIGRGKKRFVKLSNLQFTGPSQ